MEILQFSTKVAALDKVFQYRSPTRLRPRLRPTDLAMSVNQLMEISPLMGVYHMLCCVCVSAFSPSSSLPPPPQSFACVCFQVFPPLAEIKLPAMRQLRLIGHGSAAHRSRRRFAWDWQRFLITRLQTPVSLSLSFSLALAISRSAAFPNFYLINQLIIYTLINAPPIMVSFSSHKRRQLTQIPDAASSLPPSLCLLSLSLRHLRLK